VIDLDTGRLRGIYEGDPCFAFHHVNAFEREGELVIDLCAYPDARIVEGLYLENLRREKPVLPQPELRRYRVRLDSARVSYEPLSELGLELPRINYSEHNGRPYRHVYGVAQSTGGEFLDEIVKVDLEDGSSHVWQEPGSFPGEPVFVPRPDGGGEDDGVLLALNLDGRSESSSLLVLDAHRLEPLARVAVPQAIPFGFHGQFERGLQI
jgi:carotenoid cleavage dioxygenase-like enzyme